MKQNANQSTAILDDAIVFATEAHKGMMRKGTDIPYILHPLEAAAIVGTMTQDPEVIAAAVLHDTVEDNEHITLDDIRKRFGLRIRNLVAAESEIKEEDAAGSWQRRKEATVRYLSTEATKFERIIALGDKLSNIRAMHRDYTTIGDELWERFNQQDKTMHGWYYREIAKALEPLSRSWAYKEYCSLVEKVFGANNFYCPVYEGMITEYDCSEISCGVSIGYIPNDGLPPLMSLDAIQARRNFCLLCNRNRSASEEEKAEAKEALKPKEKVKGPYCLYSDQWLEEGCTSGYSVGVTSIVDYKLWTNRAGRFVGVTVNYETASDVHFELLAEDWSRFLQEVLQATDQDYPADLFGNFLIKHPSWLDFFEALQEHNIPFKKIAFY